MDIKISKYQAPRKANPFDGVVAQLIDAQAEAEQGDILAAEVPVPADIKVSTAQAKIREAAREAGFRARIRNLDEEKRVITVTVHERKASADEASTDEAPADEAGSEVAESPEEG